MDHGDDTAPLPKIVYPRPDFEYTTEKHGLRRRDLAGPGVGVSTIHAMLNPKSQKRRRGGVLRKTAMAISNHFVENGTFPASMAELTAEEAFTLLFVNEKLNQ